MKMFSGDDGDTKTMAACGEGGITKVCSLPANQCTDQPSSACVEALSSGPI